MTWTSKLSCSAAPPIAISFCRTLCSRWIRKRVDAAREVIGGRTKRVLVEREQAALAHQPLAVAHHVDDVARFAGIHELRVNGVRIATESRHVVRLIEVDDDEVGALAGLERAGDVAEVHRARADPRRHRQRLPRRKRRRVAADSLGEQRRQPHLLEHVEVVVRRRRRRCRCRPRRRDQASLPPAPHPSPASDCWWGCGQRRHRRPSSVRISPSSTCTQWAASTRASNSRCFFTHGTTGMPCSRRDWSTSSSVSARWVWSGNVELAGELGARPEDLDGAGVRGVRRDGGDDQRMSPPARR